jgi:hypothetical protein
VPTKLQNNITESVASKVDFMVEAVPSPSAVKHKQGKPETWVMLQDCCHIGAT